MPQLAEMSLRGGSVLAERDGSRIRVGVTPGEMS